MSMIGPQYHRLPRQSLAVLERDAALHRVSRARRWMIAGATALSAGFAALVSSIAPGHTLHPKSRVPGELHASRTAAPARRSDRMPTLASPRDLGLQGPSSTPRSSSAPSGSSAGSSQSSAQVAPDSQSVAPDPAQVASAPAPQPAPAVSGGS